MRLKKIIEADDAVAIIRDGDVVASSGYGGNGTPDELFVALAERFLRTGSPRGLTLVFAGGQGDGVDKGLSHLAHEGRVWRAALELAPNSVINVGVGSPDTVARIAGEAKIQDLITLTVDPGVIGGVPMGGLDVGAAVNFQALIDHASGFDVIDGGGLKTSIRGGQLAIEQDGKHRKFVAAVSQATFSGSQAGRRGQEILCVTERCVFRLEDGELRLAEVAPGIDVERDVLRLLPFRPRIDLPAPMDAAIFDPAPMRLRERMLDIHIDDRLSYDPETNTVFMNYAGMRVRNEADIRTILDAVDRLLAPLGKRVNSVVNYDRFTVDDDVTAAYMDAVKYVEERCYLEVTRYTNSGLLRLKLGKELEIRRLSSRVFESAAEARHGQSEGR